MANLASAASDIAGSFSETTPTAIVGAIEGSKGYLLVHFTSHDPACVWCMRSNTQLDKLILPYRENLQALRVSWEPWTAIATSKPDIGRLYNLPGLPALLLFKDGKEQWRQLWAPEGKQKEELIRVLDDCCRQ
ncbi:MAG: hypothetical protein HXY26_10265 [Hydrogenophilaceae bacterium]|nr:hypothetical protein [Hydrogenophilaceae bacterium]